MNKKTLIVIIVGCSLLMIFLFVVGLIFFKKNRSVVEPDIEVFTNNTIDDIGNYGKEKGNEKPSKENMDLDEEDFRGEKEESNTLFEKPEVVIADFAPENADTVAKDNSGEKNEGDKKEKGDLTSTVQPSKREREPLVDVGENYVKDSTEEDVDYNPETEEYYIKNQLLIDAYIGTPKGAIEEIVNEIDAEIVGYIEIIEDYQIEFKSDKSYDELMTMADYIESFSCVNMVSLNYVSDIEINYFTNDALYDDGFVCTYKSGIRKSDNKTVNYPNKMVYSDYEVIRSTAVEDYWNLEMMHISSAWNYTSGSNPVKVGIFDNYFEENRVDGELFFYDIIGGNGKFDPMEEEFEHGTHVAGIVGATANNNEGLAGVANNVRLYGFSYLNGNYISDTMCIESGITKLISNHIRIINVSNGYDELRTVAASEGNDSYRKKNRKDAKVLERSLEELLSSGYDFLIVSAAGNANGKYYKEIKNLKFDLDDNKEESNYKGNIDAKYSSILNAIDSPKLKERIIVVGAVDKEANYLERSCVGNRVDVCAPGEDILSTIPRNMNYDDFEGDVLIGYGVKSGTSQAAPHITGIAALMLQVNPSLTAVQVKRIICDDKNAVRKVVDMAGYGHNLPNAELCVKAALNTNTALKDWPEGKIAGSVKDSANGSAVKAKIYASRKDTGDYALGTYNYSFESDLNGYFSYDLPIGNYDLIVSVENYLPIVLNDINVAPDETNYINVSSVKWEKESFLAGNINGTVIDATTGENINGAIIKIKKGWNSYSGDYIVDEFGEDVTLVSDSDGAFCFAHPIGNYTIEVFVDGYIIGFFNTTSTQSDNSPTYALSPILSDDEYRIILTWGDLPTDLDSHLTYYSQDKKIFHTYYENRIGYYNEEQIASLDLDDVDGYGPETITVKTDNIGDGEFRYSVFNYSDDSQISESDAVIRIYKGNTLVRDPVHIPSNASDCCVWYAFSITKDGVKIKNEYYNTSSPAVR